MIADSTIQSSNLSLQLVNVGSEGVEGVQTGSNFKLGQSGDLSIPPSNSTMLWQGSCALMATPTAANCLRLVLGILSGVLACGC